MTNGNDARPGELRVTSAVWTVPNTLSALRLVMVPVFLWLVLAHHDVAALIVLMASGFTDYLDGKIARQYGLITRLGQTLDPIADRLYILSTLVGLAIREIIPWWLVVLLVARDLAVLAMAPKVRRERLPIPPVHFVGKAATFNLICGFPMVLLAVAVPSVSAVAEPLGWAFVWWGVGLYWFAGVIYAAQVLAMVRDKRLREQTA